MTRKRYAPIALFCLACLSLASCEGVDTDASQSRPNLYGGRGPGAGGD